MSFENNDKKFERRGFGEERRFSQANAARPRFDKPRFDRPRPENVVRAIGDKDAAPQVAVGAFLITSNTFLITGAYVLVGDNTIFPAFIGEPSTLSNKDKAPE